MALPLKNDESSSSANDAAPAPKKAKRPAAPRTRKPKAKAANAELAFETPAAREIVYGMPYKEWQAKYQKEASAEQKAAFAKANPGH